MTSTEFLAGCLWIGFFQICLGAAFVLFRLVRGPTLADRVMALDLFAIMSASFAAIFAIQSGDAGYLDIAMTTALIAFLATVAFAKYIHLVAQRKKDSEEEGGE